MDVQLVVEQQQASTHTRQAAVDRVFGTAELRKAILLRLPIKDLLARAPLVCKSWHAITQDSLVFNRRSSSAP